MFLSDLNPGKLIGAGSFGQVLHGIDTVHGDVAIKVFSQLPYEPPHQWTGRVTGALREAQLIASLEHPNIVRVYHFVRTTNIDHVLYVMELCSQGSIGKKLEAETPRLSVARRWIYQAAMGVEFLHSNKILHRDIKPDNLLIAKNGEVKVADFGLATTPLAHGFARGAGTEFYAAPEVFGRNISSIASDIWSIGATLVHALHGDEWTFKHLVDAAENFRPGGLWLPHIPKAWRLCANRMLRDNPSERCASAAEVVDQLSRLPVSVDWDCNVSSSEIRWERIKGARKVVVVWQNINTRSPRWYAWSEPTGSGRKMTLSTSDAGENFRQSHKSLSKYFASTT